MTWGSVYPYDFKESEFELPPASIALDIGYLIFKQVLSLTSKINIFCSSLKSSAFGDIEGIIQFRLSLANDTECHSQTSRLLISEPSATAGLFAPKLEDRP